MNAPIRRSHLALAIGSVLATSGIHAATITVDSLDDPGADGQCSLRQAIESVNAQMPVYGSSCSAPTGVNDTVVFDESLFEGQQETLSITLTDGQLGIYDTSVTVEGPGADVLAIDADADSRVFYIDNSEATISGLTITGGSSSYGSGLYVIYDSSLNLSDCVVTGNAASAYGGGIDIFDDSQLVVENCQITNNQAGFFGGGVSVSQGHATIIDSVISDNSAGDLGGGLWVNSMRYAYDNDGPPQQPTASVEGIIDPDPIPPEALEILGSLTVIDSEITGNTAEIGGGIGAGTFESIQELAMPESGSGLLQRIDKSADRNMMRPRHADQARGLDNEFNLRVQGSTITDNLAYAGGGIGASGSSPYQGYYYYQAQPGGYQYQPPIRTNRLSISDDTLISGNSAGYGGGVATLKYAETEILDSSIDGNTADIAGGGIFNLGVYPGGPQYFTRGEFPGIETPVNFLALENSSVSGNSVIGENGKEPQRGDYYYDYEIPPIGGGIFNALGVSYILDSSINDNYAPYLGGGVFSTQGLVLAMASQVSSNHGGGLLSLGAGGAVVYLSRIEDNHSAAVGGLSCEGDSLCAAGYSSISGNEGALAGGIGVALGIMGEYAPAGLNGGFGERGAPPDKYTQVFNSTISGNSGGVFGGIGAPEVQLAHSTVAFNTHDPDLLPEPRGADYSAYAAGGIGTTGQSTITHSIIAENVSPGIPDLNTDDEEINIEFSLIYDELGFTPHPDGSGNIFDTDPMLGSLDFNGSLYSQTHSLLDGSPAIDAGNPDIEDAPQYDQRGPGFDRIYGDRIDIGAFESQALPGEPELSLSTDSIDFGDVLVSTDAQQQLTISNNGDGPLNIGNITLGGVMPFGLASGPFSIINDECTGETLDDDQACIVDLGFEPEERDSFSQVLTIDSNDADSPHTVVLDGRGVAPVLSISPPEIDFQGVLVGATAFGSVSLTNIGDADLTLSGTDTAAPFDVVEDTGLCLDGGSTVLSPQQDCELLFSFTPPDEMSYAQVVEVFSDSLADDSTVSLQGFGDEDAPPPPPPDFDAVPVPVMNQIAMGILGGGLMLLGWLGLRRRQLN